MKWSCHVWCKEITSPPRQKIYKHRFMRHITKKSSQHQINTLFFFIPLHLENQLVFVSLSHTIRSRNLACTCVSGVCRGISFLHKTLFWIRFVVSFRSFFPVSFPLRTRFGNVTNERTKKSEITDNNDTNRNIDKKCINNQENRK